MNTRQEQILKAAIPLFLEQGVGVSTAKVAKAARISNGTLFNAYPTKQDLIDAMYLKAKLGMFEALSTSDDAGFDRATAQHLWSAYLTWARRNPRDREIMHLLVDAGLVSAAAKGRTDEMASRHNNRISDAIKDGVIRGPNADFIVSLIFFHLDLVIAQNLRREDEALAFEMLCQSIGLKE